MYNYIGYAPEYIIILLLLWILSFYYKSFKLQIVSFVLTFCILWFFQGALFFPNHIDPTILYCPCDGVVSDIIYHENSIQICVFLNIHNTHVQYSPFDCIVKSISHKPGSFHPAYLLEKSQYNERTEYVLYNEYFGNVLFVQIAGQLARRIVSFVEVEQKISAMEPVGLIKLGSRCDIYVNGHVLVKKGDRVKIGSPLVEKFYRHIL
jgi:phosphatidylserine decarboxylase